MSVDYRLKENRREAFIRWTVWSVKKGDCDPSIWMMNYLFNRFEFNTEQKLWLCWLYGHTYYLPTAWVIWNEFPDVELVGVKRLKKWNNDNFQRLRYQTDTKYNKGHLPAMFASYQTWLAGRSQELAFTELMAFGKGAPFDMMFDEITDKWHKFGRYTAWFYMQALQECCGIWSDPLSMLFKDTEGSRSHRNGMCYVLGEDDWVDAKLTPTMIKSLELEAALILEEIWQRFDLSVTKYQLETCLCSFKKLFRRDRTRFLGYYLERQAHEITTVENDGWNGINWRPMWDGRTEVLDPRLDKKSLAHLEHFLDNGRFERMEYVFEDEQPAGTGLVQYAS